MRIIDVFVYNHKNSNIDIRAEYLFSPLNKQYQINYYYKEGNSILSNFVCFLKDLNKILKDQPNIAYAMDFGPATALLFFALKLIQPHIKTMIDTGDIAYELKKLAGRSFLEQQLFRWAEWYLLKKANIIIVRGSQHKIFLEQKGFKNIYFIPDGVDTKVFKPDPDPNYRKRLGLDKVLTIGLLSSLNWEKKINYCHGWDLIETIKLLRDEPVKGILIGDGTGLPYLKRMAKEHGVSDKILFLGRKPFSDLPKLLNLFDIALLTQINDITAEIRTTGKLPLYLATGCYILSTEVGEAKMVLPKEMLLPYHGIKDSFYPMHLVEKIKNIFKEKKQISFRSAGPEIAKLYFDYKLLSDKLHEIITNE